MPRYYHAVRSIKNFYEGSQCVLSFNSKKARAAYIDALKNDSFLDVSIISNQHAKKLLSKGCKHLLVLWLVLLDEKDGYFKQQEIDNGKI
jgi:hypothetical protein